MVFDRVWPWSVLPRDHADQQVTVIEVAGGSLAARNSGLSGIAGRTLSNAARAFDRRTAIEPNVIAPCCHGLSRSIFNGLLGLLLPFLVIFYNPARKGLHCAFTRRRTIYQAANRRGTAFKLLFYRMPIASIAGRGIYQPGDRSQPGILKAVRLATREHYRSAVSSNSLFGQAGTASAAT